MLHSILRKLRLYQTNSEYDSWYEALKSRDSETWQTQWKDAQLPDSFFQSLASILSLPNHYLYPSDKLSLILFNRFADLSDVEAILHIEEALNVNINMDEVMQGQCLADLMPIQL